MNHTGENGDEAVIRLAHDLSSKVRTTDVTVASSVTFHSIARIKPSILQGLTRCGFRHPSPIQAKALPLSLIGIDMIVQAKSGTGKTVVFAVTALQALDISKNAKNHPQVLILAPTREIAQQITDVTKLVGRCVENVHVKTFIGGTDVIGDRESLRQCNIAVGTPGRIKHLISKNTLKAGLIKLLVLDEADELLASGFRQDIKEIFEALPERKQMLAVSATFNQELSQLIQEYMKSPQFVSVSSDPSLIGVKQNYISLHVTQAFRSHNCDWESKIKSQEVLSLLMTFSFSQCIIFCNSIDRARLIEKTLSENEFNPKYINGKMDQKERLEGIELLRNKRTRILISSDLVSRGIDSEFVDLVINVDLPFEEETYYHRIGRAGRFGSEASAFTIVIKSSDEERRLLTMKSVNSLPLKEYPSFYFKSIEESKKITTQDECDDESPLDEVDDVQINLDTVESDFWKFYRSLHTVSPPNTPLHGDHSARSASNSCDSDHCTCTSLSPFALDLLRVRCNFCASRATEKLFEYAIENLDNVRVEQPIISQLQKSEEAVQNRKRSSDVESIEEREKLNDEYRVEDELPDEFEVDDEGEFEYDPQLDDEYPIHIDESSDDEKVAHEPVPSDGLLSKVFFPDPKMNFIQQQRWMSHSLIYFKYLATLDKYYQL